MEDFQNHPSIETVKEITGSDQASAIAKGGYKYVFKVEPTGQQPFVLKFVRAEDTFDNDAEPITYSEPVQRCLREIDLMKRCNSDYLPKLGPIEQSYISVKSSKFLYFSEELVGQLNLKQVLKTKQFNANELKKLMFDVASALEVYAPEGIVHRDIKPDNIMKRDNSDEFVLIDSGIYYSPTESSLTPSGFYVGTTGYVSPEQMKRSPSIDARSDLYSLGVVAYEAISGVNQHMMNITGKGQLREQQILNNVLYLKPPMLIATEENGLNQELISLVDRLLEKNAYKRPKTAKQLTDILNDIGA